LAGDFGNQVEAGQVRQTRVGGFEDGWTVIWGGYVDGWAHNHLATTLESFFTPWHAAFYSGFMAVAGVTAGALLANRARGVP
jgi:hypothetical protein